MMQAANDFFALPDADRHQIAIGNSPHFRGYTLVGDERTQGKSDWRDQIDFGPDEPALTLQANDPPWLRLRGPNQWPARLPEMRHTVVSWMRAMQPLGMSVMQALAIGLGQPIDRFEKTIPPNPYPRLKVIRYPAQSKRADTGQGVGLHHDSGLLSLVLQDEVQGLQVQTDGHLVDVPHKTGAYVMNLGEMLQAASNGYLRATKHRVESPPLGKHGFRKPIL
jgi:isopenicillin N synthase-like dioxygenase